MADEQRKNASGADAWVPDEGSPESAYEGRQPQTDAMSGTRVGRAAPPTGVGAGSDSSERSTQRDRDDETVREGGGSD